MADSDALKSRCKSIENAFFSDLDQKLIRELQEKMTSEEAISKLKAESGIHDLATLKSLHELGITPQALSAVRIFPLAAVAWADGNVDEQEAVTIRMIADNHIDKDSDASKLLERWLKEKPTEEMFQSWENCVNAVFASMNVAESQGLKLQLVEELNKVAIASGGLLGWGATSKSESDAVTRIRNALGVRAS